MSANPPLLTLLKRSNAATAANLIAAAAWIAGVPASAVAPAAAVTAPVADASPAPMADVSVATAAAAAPQSPATRFVPVPYPLGPEKIYTLKELFEKLLWRFDRKGKIEPTIVTDDKTGIRRYGAYLFFNSKHFVPDRMIDSPANPFHHERYGDLERKFTREGFKIDEDQKTKEDKNKADFMEIAATEFKIHLMPKSEYMLATIKSIFDFLALHPRYSGFIHSIKVTRQPGLKDKDDKALPSIVIYPALGKTNFLKTLEFLHAVFPNEICKTIGSKVVPRFNRIINELIFYSNGGGDFKYSLNQVDRTRFLSFSQVHFWECEPITKDIEGIFGVTLPPTSFEYMPQPFGVAARDAAAASAATGAAAAGKPKVQRYEAYEGPANMGDPIYIPVEGGAAEKDSDADMKDANDFAGAGAAASASDAAAHTPVPHTPPLRFTARRSLAISSPDLKKFSARAQALKNNVDALEQLESKLCFEAPEQGSGGNAVVVKRRPRD